MATIFGISFFAFHLFKGIWFILLSQL
jgi:hypothetical protein